MLIPEVVAELTSHTSEVTVALISSMTTLLVAMLGIVGLYVQNRRHGRIIQQTYEHVNNVEDAERIPEPGEEPRPRPTLGSLLRELDRKVADGFKENMTTHEDIRNEVDGLRDAIHQNGQRLDAHERSLQRIRRDIDVANGKNGPHEPGGG